jgi:hypothetical protein
MLDSSMKRLQDAEGTAGRDVLRRFSGRSRLGSSSWRSRGGIQHVGVALGRDPFVSPIHASDPRGTTRLRTGGFRGPRRGPNRGLNPRASVARGAPRSRARSAASSGGDRRVRLSWTAGSSWVSSPYVTLHEASRTTDTSRQRFDPVPHLQALVDRDVHSFPQMPVA